jgi:hypothetical protein
VARVLATIAGRYSVPVECRPALFYKAAGFSGGFANTTEVSI